MNAPTHLFSNDVQSGGEYVGGLSSHPVTYEDHKARILFRGPVTDTSIFSLCEEIELAVRYYRYPEVELLIDSPGGQLAYLEYFLCRLRQWRIESRFCLSTVALTKALSAAGVILALGDIGHRRAYPGARILLHDVRIDPHDMAMDKGHLSKIHAALETADRRLLSQIASHIYIGKVLAEKESGPGGKIIYRHREISLIDAHGKIRRLRTRGSHLEEKEVMHALKRLQELDMPISPEFALQLLVIDHIEGQS